MLGQNYGKPDHNNVKTSYVTVKNLKIRFQGIILTILGKYTRYRDVFRTQSHIYDGVLKSSIIGVSLSSKYTFEIAIEIVTFFMLSCLCTFIYEPYFYIVGNHQKYTHSLSLLYVRFSIILGVQICCINML